MRRHLFAPLGVGAVIILAALAVVGLIFGIGWLIFTFVPKYVLIGLFVAAIVWFIGWSTLDAEGGAKRRA